MNVRQLRRRLKRLPNQDAVIFNTIGIPLTGFKLGEECGCCDPTSFVFLQFEEDN